MYDDLEKKYEDAQFKIGEYERQIDSRSAEVDQLRQVLGDLVETVESEYPCIEDINMGLEEV